MVAVRLVTLDMVGTVFRFSRPPAAQYQEVAARHGLNLGMEELSSSFSQQWRHKNHNFPHFGSTTPGLSSIMWWHQLVKVTFPFPSLLSSHIDHSCRRHSGAWLVLSMMRWCSVLWPQSSTVTITLPNLTSYSRMLSRLWPS